MMEEGTVVYSDDTKPQNCHKLGGAKCRDQAGVASDHGEPIAIGHVRFTPESGHVRRNFACPLWANSGH